MTYTVAARYGFSEAEMRAMPLSRLAYWYKGEDLWRPRKG